MKNVIVGTSGHVDHGKTCLIKALSGIDTDRLKEEKKRGITIELGFANLENDRDLRIGIIDVPGHEKFVRNMLAGIGGIDLVLLVIGLDEGVMPQTVEHFEIIKSLGIKNGIIVFTKSDISEPDMYDLVQDDVDALVKGSFLENAKRIRVSSYTGENIELLRNMILDFAEGISDRRNAKELFRLPIDRVFTMEGFGTVVTGTLMEGCVSADDEVEIYPQKKRIKVRQVQSHNTKEQVAYAGQRTALNLAGVSKEDLDRGEVIAFPGSIILSDRINVSLRLFDKTKRKLKNNDRIHINYGSNQTECRVVLIDNPVLTAGQQSYAQLVFDSPVPVKRSDKFIIRFLSPVETFGGGRVLAVDVPKYRKAKDIELASRLSILENLDIRTVAEEILRESTFALPDKTELSIRLNLSFEETDNIFASLYKEGKIIKIGANQNLYIHKTHWNDSISYCLSVLNTFHEKNSILPGMPKEELKQLTCAHFHIPDFKKADELISALISRSKICLVDGAVAAPGFAASYSSENRTMLDDIEKIYKDAGIQIPDTFEVIGKFQDQKLARQMINDLAKKNVLVKINNNCYIYREFFDGVVAKLREHFNTNKLLTLAQFRDMYNTSRKYALIVLEFCDYRGYTKLVGDARIPLFK